MNLYKFYWDCGRSGSLEGLFAATQEEIDAALGKRAYFGEVLGKYSEIYGTLTAEDLTKLDIPEASVMELVKAIGYTTISGFNPIDVIREREEEEGNED